MRGLGNPEVFGLSSCKAQTAGGWRLEAAGREDLCKPGRGCWSPRLRRCLAVRPVGASG